MSLSRRRLLALGAAVPLLYVGSGFRAQSYQTAVFAVQVKRWGDEQTANRYSAEPWHARWVGAELATRLQALAYQQWADLSADDAVSMLRVEAGLDKA